MGKLNFDTVVNRSLMMGGIGCLLPFYFLLQLFGSASLHRWHIYAAAATLLICLGIVNKTRELLNKKSNMLMQYKNIINIIKMISIIASFMVGAILSLGFSLIFFLLGVHKWTL